MSLSLERVPLQWKTSCVVPDPRSAHPSEPNHFRPVALTSLLMKTLERIILGHLRHLVHKTDPLQFAYQLGIGVPCSLPSFSPCTHQTGKQSGVQGGHHDPGLDVKGSLNPQSTRDFIGSARCSFNMNRNTDRERSHKAAGLDGVCPWLLEGCSAQLAVSLQCIFNRSLQLGRIPVLWKTSCLMPVPKVKQPAEMTDQWPSPPI